MRRPAKHTTLAHKTHTHRVAESSSTSRARTKSLTENRDRESSSNNTRLLKKTIVMATEEKTVTPAAEEKVRALAPQRAGITQLARISAERARWVPSLAARRARGDPSSLSPSIRFCSPAPAHPSASPPLHPTTTQQQHHHQPQQPTPVFGSASTFAGTGGFTGVAAAAPAAAGGDGADGAANDEDGPAQEEECQAEFKPIVQLQEVETNTGEEDEDVSLELKCKLYRFDASGNEWKERGLGAVKLLRHKASGRTRLLMREARTLKIRANHIVMPGTKLQEHSGSDKAWVWSAVDFAEEEQRVELFCIRFGSPEKAAEFKKGVEAAAAKNAEVLGVDAAESGSGEGSGEGEEEGAEKAAAAEKKEDAADALAGDLAKAKVEEDGGEKEAAAADAAPKAAEEAA
jgi:Ran-binding protein 1